MTNILPFPPAANARRLARIRTRELRLIAVIEIILVTHPAMKTTLNNERYNELKSKYFRNPNLTYKDK